MSLDEITAKVDPPLYVVTAAADDERSGCLVGFATQCSIHPPRFLVCLSVLNHTYEVARKATALAVHLIGADQAELAACFGERTGDDLDKFADLAWHPGTFGAPIVEEASACFEGAIVARLPFGDHVGHLLAPVEEVVEARPPEEGVLHLRDVSFHAGHPPDELLVGGAPPDEEDDEEVGALAGCSAKRRFRGVAQSLDAAFNRR